MGDGVSSREMWLSVFSKMRMQIPAENVTAHRNLNNQLISAVLPLLNKLPDELVPHLLCNG